MARNFVPASSQYLSKQGGGALVSGEPLTMACWFKPSNVSGTTSKSLMCIDNSVNLSSFMLLRSVGGTGQASALTTFDGGTSPASTTAGGATNGVWHHYAGVFASNASRTAYLDGVAATTNTDTLNVGTLGRTTIGIVWAIQYAEGDIAEAAFWNVALSAAEILALSRGYSPLFIRPANIIAYLPMFGNDSPELDRWKNRHDFSLVNAPTKADHPPIIYPY